MGVPSLYRWLTQKYPEIKRGIYTTSNFYTDNLYLDFNAIVHPCCNKELDTLEQTERQMYANLESYLDKIMEIIKPKRLLYIAIDGVAPRAKLNQQRSRRFVKARESLERGEEYFSDSPEDAPAAGAAAGGAPKRVFDVNAITPGTKFMDRLDHFLKDLIKSKLSTDARWAGLNVIYTNYKVPGEGEQKIMEYIRKHQNPRARHVIYSPDADLIFLGLTLYDYNVFIMREEPKRPGLEAEDGIVTEDEIVINSYDGRDFVLVDIQKLKGLLIDDFRAVIRDELDCRNFMRDWVLLCFSVGNDFLPCAPCFEIRTNAVEKITSILLSLYRKTRKCITNGPSIDFRVLKAFFAECALREDDFLVEKNRNLLVSRARMQLPFDPRAEFALNSEQGKIRFYIEKMGVESEEALLVACKEYIKGLVWIYNYYFYEVPSWDWYYPYHFAPFMCDLARVSDVNVAFTMNRPLRPFEQLLCVLPPLSKGLVPDVLHDVFELNREQYPMDFKIDTFQKVMDWQAVPILPFMDVQTIRRDYDARQRSLSYADMDRNVIGYPMLFSAHPVAIKKAENIYGGGRAFEQLTFEEYRGRVFPLNCVNDLDTELSTMRFKYTNRAVVFSFDQRFGRLPPKK